MRASRDNLRGMSTLTLIGRVVNNVSVLLDRQVELAKTELRETALETVRGAATLVAGIVFGLLALSALMMAAVLALALFMPGWLAALIVFAALGLISAILLLIAKRELQTLREHPLSRTRESLREDMQWASHRLISSER